MKIVAPFLLFTLLNVFQSSAQKINSAKLDSFFNQLSDHNKIMGSFAVAKDGKLVYERSVGYSLLGKDSISSSSATQYRIGSITKTFTATMIFQLIEKGQLSLDTKLSRCFPQMPGSEKITIKHLLSHTSGLMDFANDVSNQMWITTPLSNEEILDTIAKAKLHFEPGTKQQYNNSGYLLLRYFLEKITGKSYSKLLANEIVKKIGLKNTYSSIPNNYKIREARPYSMLNYWTENNDIYFTNVIGVGDILSTPADLIKFMKSLTSGQLIRPENYAQMCSFENQSELGMGLKRVPFYNQIGVGHDGVTNGSNSVIYYFKNSGISIATCVNGLNCSLNDVNIAILSISNGMQFQIPEF